MIIMLRLKIQMLPVQEGNRPVTLMIKVTQYRGISLL